MKNIIFIAPPASGKGTYSSMLKKNYSYTHISTGDVLRSISSSNTDLGKEVAEVLQSGNLVNDELMFRIIRQELEKLDPSKPFILDGLPRTLDQTKYLDTLFEELGLSNYVVLYLETDYEIALKRALGRITCPKCHATYNKYFDAFKPKVENKCDICNEELVSRTDDNEESFKIRFENYNTNTKPILDYYQEKEKLVKINTGDFTNEQIFDIILDVVN